jgi:membrane protein
MLHVFVTRASAWNRFWTTLRAAAVHTYDDNCLSIAKGAAYSGLFSFFPVLTTVATLLVQAQADAVSRTIAEFLYDVVPPGTEDVVQQLFIVKGQRPVTLLVVAAILAAWAASGAVMSLMEGFRAIYDLPSGRPWLKERGMGLLLVFVAVLPVWCASTLIVLGTRTERTVVYWLGVLPAGADLTGWVSVIGRALRFGVAFGCFVLVTALVYHFGPNRKQAVRRVLPGAFLATLLWLLATEAFAWWVRHVANYNVLYGSVGAGLALLAWMYVLAVIMLFGCEFNAARERVFAGEDRSGDKIRGQIPETRTERASS